MEELTVGSVILIRFPFSDLKRQKIRPALIVARTDFNDLIICQISSKQLGSIKSVVIKKQDFTAGALPVTSFARPTKLFTLSRSVVIKKIAQLKKAKSSEVLSELRAVFSE